MMANMIKTQVTDSLMDMIDGETVADVIAILSKYQSDDVIEVEWSSFEDVDIYVYRTREKTEEELKLDAIKSDMEDELRELHGKMEGERTSIGNMISRTQRDLDDLRGDCQSLDSEELDRIRVIRSHYAQEAGTVR